MAHDDETVLYRIETRDNWGNWTPDEIGNSSDNFFDSVDEAVEVIEALRALGDEWATTEYRVVRAGLRGDARVALWRSE